MGRGCGVGYDHNEKTAATRLPPSWKTTTFQDTVLGLVRSSRAGDKLGSTSRKCVSP